MAWVKKTCSTSSIRLCGNGITNIKTPLSSTILSRRICLKHLVKDLRLPEADSILRWFIHCMTVAAAEQEGLRIKMWYDY
jgi:hypothetical protein